MSVNPHLAKYAAAVYEFTEKLDRDPEFTTFFELFAPIEHRIYTADGLTVKFLEEGIDFYPSEED